MYQSQIEALLRSKAGWATETIIRRDITRAIEQRRLACNLPDIESYWQKIRQFPQELEALIEQLVVPETWFFRDEKPFTLLTEYVLQKWLPKHSSPLRLLSLPCSTGEEPYSIAMSLLDAGLLPQQFQIDAVDISPQLLQKARTGVYGRNSFRGNQLEFRDRYFTQQGSDYHLAEPVKRTVQFHCENLLNPNLFLGQQPYPVVFCRNVLIYFDEPAKQQAMRTLDRLLREEGLLFLGCAETVIVPSTGFTAIRYPSAFAFRKQSSVPPPQTRQLSQFPSSTTPSPASINPSIHKSNRSTMPSRSVAPRFPLQSPAPSPHTPHLSPPGALRPSPNLLTEQVAPNQLATARKFADQGNLVEAAQLCEACLQQNRTDVAAQVLLGQVYQAQGREQDAEICFQRAIFLDPKHTEALVHLALLKEQQGDTRATALLWQRVQRSSISSESD